jgi:uncharacterized membrane protein/diacylglycerol kinase
VIHLVASLLVGAGIFYFHVSRNEIILLVLAMGFVWVAEIFNTAVEKIMDFISPEYHPETGAIKDLAAAAVLLSAITAIIAGILMMITELFKIGREDKLSLKHWLFISCCFSCGLVCARVAATGYHTYLFLVWNLFLGIVPYFISEWLYRNIVVLKHRVKTSLLMLLWLLFIPNSFYIVTDLFHLEEFNAAPKWFDLLLIFSFAWNGLLLGVLSIRKIEMILSAMAGKSFSLLIILVVMWLNAFGVYIGRYLRYNSWDVFVQPFSLFGEMLNVVIHPLQNKMEWGMITVWAFFMTLIYITIRKMGESFITGKAGGN